MNRQQTLFRLLAYIIKDKQRIRGYKLALLGAENRLKINGYNQMIVRLEKSIHKKEEAINAVKQAFDEEFVWKEICSRYGFRNLG